MKTQAIAGSLSRLFIFLGAVTCAYAQPTARTPYSFTTLAGVAAIGSTDGPGNVARFNFPGGVACDAAGNLYVADSSNHTIRKITAAGIVSTLAGKAGYQIDANDPKRGDGTGADARFSEPAGVAVDAAGNVFVAGGSDNAIRKITPTGVVTTVAGGGPVSPFNVPEGITVDASGNLYVADTYNNAVKKITPAGVVSTLAGGSYGTADGSGSAAQFYNPRGIAVDSTGTVYVGDTGNNTIRKITPAGDVTTIAGAAGVFGHADGMGTAAQFSVPSGLTIDLAGNLYVADYGNSTVRKIAPSGAVTTVAGAPITAGHIDGNFSVARFYTPQGIAVDAAGNLFVADAVDQTIRQVTPAAITSTIAGLSPLQSGGSTDGAGADARFRQPVAVATGPAGELYVADLHNHTIRKITPNGVVSTLAGSPNTPGYADGIGAAAQFNFPTTLAVDAAGNVYVTDQYNSLVRKVTPAGLVSTVAGRAGIQTSLDGPSGTGTLGYMMGIAVMPNGNLVVSEVNNVRIITPDGTLTTLPIVSSQPYSYFGDVAVDTAGNIYVLDVDFGDVVIIAPSGTVTRLKPRFTYAYGIAVDRAGNIFATGQQNHVVWKLSLDGVASVIGGLSGVRGSSDGTGENALFESPCGIAVDAAGNVYVTCSAYNSNTIRKGQAADLPVITVQPQSQNVVQGGDAQLSVTATGLPAPAFLWYLNGASLGVTGNTLTISHATTANAGDYTVTATNAVGTVTSNKATLTVSSSPVNPPTPPASSGGGGGGAVSLWFYLALLVLGSGRILTRRQAR